MPTIPAEAVRRLDSVLSGAFAGTNDATADSSATKSPDFKALVPYAHLALGDVLRLAGRLDEAAAEWRAMIAFEEARGSSMPAGCVASWRRSNKPRPRPRPAGRPRSQ
jgi:hypothetical protein